MKKAEIIRSLNKHIIYEICFDILNNIDHLVLASEDSEGLRLEYYLIRGSKLFVVGDFGFAMYSFKESTFESISEISLKEFHQNCIASEVGLPFNGNDNKIHTKCKFHYYGLSEVFKRGLVVCPIDTNIYDDECPF
jgi:hypothetical protein